MDHLELASEYEVLRDAVTVCAGDDQRIGMDRVEVFSQIAVFEAEPLDAPLSEILGEAFAPELLHDADLRALMRKITLELDPGCDAAFPSRRSATVAITTTDGQTFEHHRPTRKGDPDDPLSDEEVSAKFQELAAPVLGTHEAGELERALWDVDALQDVRAIPLETDTPVALHG